MELLDSANLAARWGVTTETVRRWIRTGKLRAYRVAAPGGQCYAITPAQADDFEANVRPLIRRGRPRRQLKLFDA